jgi:hypothetical protein
MIDDDDVEWDKGYNHAMKDVDGIKRKTFQTFYTWYGIKHNMTKHQINEKLISIGMKEYNKEFGQNKPFKTVREIQQDMERELVMSFSDTISVLQDRGMMMVLQKELNVDNAHAFLHKMGVEYDG